MKNHKTKQICRKEKTPALNQKTSVTQTLTITMTHQNETSCISNTNACAALQSKKTDRDADNCTNTVMRSCNACRGGDERPRIDALTLRTEVDLQAQKLL